MPFTAQELIALGYRRVSNKYRHVARIDRPDWLDHLARELRRAPADFYTPGKNHPAGNWCDYYRRCLSLDVITVKDAETFRQIPSSGHDPVGYVEAGEPKLPQPGTVERAAKTRYFQSSDNDCHRYYIPWDRREEWYAWCDIPSDDERAWEVPEFAIPIDGGTLTFENPRIETDG